MDHTQHGDPGIEGDDAARTPDEDAAGTSGTLDDTPAIEPLTLPVIGRLFAVPLVIISLIVGGAVCVVLLFGGPATAPHRSIWELVQTLEANSGERSLGLLLHRSCSVSDSARRIGESGSS